MFVTMMPFPFLQGSGCCRESSQTSRSGERRDGRGACKCCFWKVGITGIIHRAADMLLNIRWLPKAAMYLLTAIWSGHHSTQVTSCTEMPTSLFLMNCSHFTVASDTFDWSDSLNSQGKPSGRETAPGGKNCTAGGRARRGAKQHRGNGWSHEESGTAGRTHSSTCPSLFVLQQKLSGSGQGLGGLHLSLLLVTATLTLAGRAAEQWAGNRALSSTEEWKCPAATRKAEQRAEEQAAGDGGSCEEQIQSHNCCSGGQNCFSWRAIGTGSQVLVS